MQDPKKLNQLALRLKALHIPSNPVIFANVYDAATAQALAKNPDAKAIATASFAIAETQGVDDDDMTFEQNIQGITNVAAGLKRSGRADEIPLSADVQDGYADPAETVRAILKLGVVGCNIEDLDNSVRPIPLRSIEDAAARIKQVKKAATDAGVTDFVINARTDVFGYDGTVADVIERGKAYLAAGATTVFVWGARKKIISEGEVHQMVKELGMLAVQPGGLDIATLKKAGVARISVGPMLFKKSLEVYTQEAKDLLAA